MATRKRIPLEVRLLHRREIAPSGCWEWTGARDRAGYGAIGGEIGTPKILKTHRASWQIFKGPIPKGIWVLHRCDNPPCFNPEHLFLGTDADNAADRVAKGRQPRGENHHLARLTDQEVREIRNSYIPPIKIGWRYRSNAVELSQKYGVSTGLIKNIVGGRQRREK